MAPTTAHDTVSSDTQPSGVHIMPPVGAACGPPAAVFMVMFTSSASADDKMFGPERTFLILPKLGKGATADSFRRSLAIKSGHSANEFEVSRGIFFVSNGPSPQAQQSAEGSGYTLVISQAPPQTQVSMCSISEGRIEKSLANVPLGDDELLLVRLAIDGAPYVMAIHATINIDDPKTHAMRTELVDQQTQFRQSLIHLSMKNPVRLKMTALPPGTLECLQSGKQSAELPVPPAAPDRLRNLTGGERVLLWGGATGDSIPK